MIFKNFKEEMMGLALEEAKKAESLGEVPVGAIVEFQGKVIGKGYNQPILTSDTTAHAEIIAIRDAGRNINNYRLDGMSIYSTLEPCMMCASSMVHARILKLYFGAEDKKSGVIISQDNFFDSIYLNHKIDFEGGVLHKEASLILKDFFSLKRFKV